MDIGEVSDGYDWERKVLGHSCVDVSPDISHLIKRRTKFYKAVKFVKEIQPMLDWDPKNPGTEIAKIISGTIRSTLGKYSSGFCFYSAVGTILDYKYSTDCFFTLEIGNKEAIVTADLTISKNKFSKADIVIAIDDARNDHVYDVAREIGRRLLSKLHAKMNKKRRYNKLESYKNKYCFTASP